MSEAELQQEILDYLNKNGVFAFRINTIGVYDSNSGVYRKPGKFALKGISDIIGIYKGAFIAVEVKSETGRLSKEQATFIDKVRRVGGYATWVNNMDDLKEFVLEIKEDLKWIG